MPVQVKLVIYHIAVLFHQSRSIHWPSLRLSSPLQKVKCSWVKLKKTGKWLRVNKMPSTVQLWPCFSAIHPFHCRFIYVTKFLLVFYKCMLLVFEVFENVVPVKKKLSPAMKTWLSLYFRVSLENGIWFLLYGRSWMRRRGCLSLNLNDFGFYDGWLKGAKSWTVLVFSFAN